MSGIGDVQYWMRARCAPGPRSVTPVKRLWDDYKGWCEVNGFDVALRKDFVREMGRAGAVVEDSRGVPRPFKRQGLAMAGRIHLKHEPPAEVVPREPWQRRGPSGPTGAKQRARWRGTSDSDEEAPVAEWIDDSCARVVWAEVPLGECYADYLLWAEGVNGGEPWHLRGFAIQLRALGLRSRRVSGQVRFMGIALRPDRQTAPRTQAQP